MEVSTREDTIIFEGLRIYITLKNGKEYRITEDFDELVINKLEDSISIKPEYANQITIK